MNERNGSAAHLADEEMVWLLDREAEVAIRSTWDEHLSGCLACAERLHELEQASGWLHDHLPELDRGVEVDEMSRARALSVARKVAVPAPAPRPATGFAWGRAAAVVGFLVIGGMTVQPVRAWVFDGVERLVGLGETPAPVAIAPAPLRAGAMVSFQPSARVFSIELDHAQTAGTISITAVDGSGATAQVLDGTDESLSVLPAALLVGNAASSEASYTIELPTQIVRTVQVVVEGRIVLEAGVTGQAEPVVLDLAASSSR